MSRNWTVIILLMCFLFQQGLSSQDIVRPEKMELPDQKNSSVNINSEEGKESDIRRMEIVFLLSLPFTAIMSFLLLNGAYLIVDPAYTFSMVTLPHEILPFSIFSAVFASSIITYSDYRTIQNKKKQDAELENTGPIRELHYGIGFQRKF